MKVDPDKIQDYLTGSSYSRVLGRRIGRTTTYLAMMRDHVVNGFMAEKFAFIATSNASIPYVKGIFLDMLADWDMTPTRVSSDMVVVNSHQCMFMAGGYARCAMTGTVFNAIFVDSTDAFAGPEEIVRFVSRTGLIYGYE